VTSRRAAHAVGISGINSGIGGSKGGISVINGVANNKQRPAMAT